MYDYDNYYTDARVMAGERNSIFSQIDLGRMRGTVDLTYWDEDDNEINETVQMPIRCEVCPLCHGRGSHVNPSIDCNGLTAEDFADDPDFCEAYMSGQYDQTCNECNGRTTVPVLVEENLSDEQTAALARIREQQRDEADHQRECAAERRMGY